MMHLTVDQEPCTKAPVSLAADVQRRERLGGLLNVYHREAA